MSGLYKGFQDPSRSGPLDGEKGIFVPGLRHFHVVPEQIHHPPRDQGSSLRLPEEGLRFEDLEKDLIRQAIERTSGNQTRAAKLLGLTRNTLLYRMQKFGLMKGDLDN